MIVTPFCRVPGRVLAAFALVLLLTLPRLALADPGQSDATRVKFGLYVTSLSGIDPADGSFAIEGYAWFLAPPGANFDASHDIELFGRHVTMSPFLSKPLKDGHLYSVMTFSGVIDHAYDVSRYPFDRQDLRLHFEAARPAEDILFMPDVEDTRIAREVRAPGFHVAGITLATHEEVYDTTFGHGGTRSAFSRLVVTLHLERNISPLLFEKFTGYFVAFVIAALVIFVPVSELGTRIGMTTGAIFAAVFNLYRLEDAIGFDAVFGVVDRVSILVFSVILMQLALAIWVNFRFRAGRHDVAMRVNYALGGLVAALHGALLLAVFIDALH